MTKTSRQKYLSKEEYERFLATIEDARDYILFLLCGSFGLRVGEVIRLRKEDVDFTNNYIRIPTLKQEIKKGVKKGSIAQGMLPSKYVDLPLEESLKKILIRYVKIYYIKDWLFPWHEGTDLHIPKWKVQRMFKLYARHAELSEFYSIHSLRHYMGMRIYTDFKDIKLVQKVLRHKNLNSSQFYADVNLENLRDLMDKYSMIKEKDQKANEK